MSYTFDVYRGKVEASTNFLNFATYVTLFPQLVAGPIVRYEEVAKELTQRNTTVADFSEGIRRFVIGFGKKMLLANNLAYVADGAFELPAVTAFHIFCMGRSFGLFTSDLF
jgi:alginate O-acetyltransferase complex protein AlgI